MRSKSFISSIFPTLLGLLIGILSTFFIVPMLYKIGGKETIGIYSIFSQVLGGLVLLDFGLSTSLVRNLSGPKGLNSEVEGTRYVLYNGRLLFILSSILCSIGLIFIGYKSNLFFDISERLYIEFSRSLFVMAFWYLFGGYFAVYGMFLYAKQYLSIYNYSLLIQNISKLAISLILLYLDFGLYSFAFSTIISEMITYWFQFFYFTKYFEINYESEIIYYKLSILKKISRFGLEYYGVMVSTFLLISSDSIILGSILSASAVGVYFSTKAVGNLFVSIFTKFIDNLSPGLNDIYTHDGLLKSNLISYSLLVLLNFCLMPIFGGLLLFTQFFVENWLNSDMVPSDLMVLFLALCVVVQINSHFVGTLLVALRKVRGWSIVSLIFGIINVLLSRFMVRDFGLDFIQMSFFVIMLLILVLNIRNVGRVSRPLIEELSVFLVTILTYFILVIALKYLTSSIIVRLGYFLLLNICYLIFYLLSYPRLKHINLPKFSK